MNDETQRYSGMRSGTAVLVSVACIATVGVMISVGTPSENAARTLSVSIREGQFVAEPGATLPEVAQVAAGKPVEVKIRSLDYVYAVQHNADGKSVVVLPRAESRVFVTFRKGPSRLSIVQGCGRLFGSHRTSIDILAGH